MQPITRDLAISHSAMGAVLGAWPLVYIAAAAACGALTDRMGPRRKDRQINPAAKSEGLAGAPQSGA